MKPLDIDPNEQEMIEAGDEQDSIERASEAYNKQLEKELREHDKYDSIGDR